MILSPPIEWSAEPSAERPAQRERVCHCANVMCKVRRTSEGDRSTDAMAAIASGASSATPKWIPRPSAPPLSSQLERWRLLWWRRWCQRSQRDARGVVCFLGIRDPITQAEHISSSARRMGTGTTRKPGTHRTRLPRRNHRLHAQHPARIRLAYHSPTISARAITE